ncbi:MAG: c-type cytochrome [Gemmataceae bacterium]|nr:c-type cytochrome [Gemmataceae bacterium]
MKRPNPCWYHLALLLALLLPGLRVLTWPAPTIHAVEAASAETGKMLFTHDWQPRDPLANGGDGLGPVYNATSCVACHGQPTLGGASGRDHNVTMYTLLPARPGGDIQQGVVHVMAVDSKYQETLAKVEKSLPHVSKPKFEPVNTGGRTVFAFNFTIPSNVVLSQRNTPALYGAKWIDEIADRDLIAQEKQQHLKWGLAPASSEQYPVGRALRLPDGRVGKFGWKAQSASLLEFVQAACANELGLGNPAQAQPNPIGRPDYKTLALDLTNEQCQQMTDFLLTLARPIERAPANAAARAKAEAGRTLFHQVGCADCHTPNLGSVEGLYSDLLLHRMGFDLQGGGFYYGAPMPASSGARTLPMADEWRTPPLWGVADTGPWLHDGRAKTLEEAIQLHGGQGTRSAGAFAKLSATQQAQMIEFLKTLRAPQ